MQSSGTDREDDRCLRRAMRDLVALSTLPAVWIGLGPEGIAPYTELQSIILPMG